MKLFLYVVCVMAVIAVNGSDLTDSGLQKEKKNHQPQNFREIISLDQDFDAQSRKAACSDKGGRCIRNKSDCPNNLPLTEFGKTFCRKGRRCCVPDTICNRLCEEDRSGSPPPATVCWGSPDGKDTASFPGPCWAERAAECDPNYANWIYKFDGTCFCQLQKVMDKCKDEVAETARYYYNWDEKRCVEFAFDLGCSTNANNFVSSEDCFNTCAAFSPPSENWQLIRNACIKGNKYKTLNDSSIENCEKICEEDEKNGIACKSVTYHLSTRLCLFSELGSTSDAYTQPCYLEGFDLYEYTKIGAGSPCEPSPCGINAECTFHNQYPICKCPMGYIGDPWIGCTIKGPCDTDPCGINAYCHAKGDEHICTCANGYKGDPLVKCDLRDPCQSNTCGEGTNCFEHDKNNICTCPFGYTGDPLSKCTSPQEAHGCPDLPQDLFCFAATQRCYKFLSLYYTWPEANAVCKEQNLELAEISDPVPVRSYIEALFADLADTWLGAKGTGFHSGERGRCCQKWTRRGYNLSATEYWFDNSGAGVSINCLVLNTWPHRGGTPEQCYYTRRCHTPSNVLCELV